MSTEQPRIEYIEARRALLDALTALKPHIDAFVLIGAQAVYLRALTACPATSHSPPMPIWRSTQVDLPMFRCSQTQCSLRASSTAANQESGTGACCDQASPRTSSSLSTLSCPRTLQRQPVGEEHAFLATTATQLHERALV